KTSIFSHPVYLFLREFSLQDFRGGSEYSSRHVLTRYRPSLFTHRALVLQADFEYRKPAGIAG
ncbi:hypothetical protein, partial [Escherichia coli]|uniref:hypothetical protein n=1 Tax=Escherichia coli TaxID=562 RepID=UPI0010D708DA